MLFLDKGTLNKIGEKSFCNCNFYVQMILDISDKWLSGIVTPVTVAEDQLGGIFIFVQFTKTAFNKK